MRTSLEPSNIAGSPYIYLTFFLTEREYHGPHIVVSDGRELAEDGIWVGFNDPALQVGALHDSQVVESFPTLQEALIRVKELADGH